MIFLLGPGKKRIKTGFPHIEHRSLWGGPAPGKKPLNRAAQSAFPLFFKSIIP